MRFWSSTVKYKLIAVWVDVDGGALMKRKQPAHALAGQRIFVAGAPDGGYIIPDNGMINRDSRGPGGP